MCSWRTSCTGLIPGHLNLHPLFPHAYFCHKCNSLLLVPKSCPHKGRVIIKDVLLLEVLFYCINCSEFLVLTYYIPKIIIWQKRSKHNAIFWGSVVAVPCLSGQLLLTCKMPPCINQGSMILGVMGRFSCKEANLWTMFYSCQCSTVMHHSVCFYLSSPIKRCMIQHYCGWSWLENRWNHVLLKMRNTTQIKESMDNHTHFVNF